MTQDDQGSNCTISLCKPKDDNFVEIANEFAFSSVPAKDCSHNNAGDALCVPHTLGPIRDMPLCSDDHTRGHRDTSTMHDGSSQSVESGMTGLPSVCQTSDDINSRSPSPTIHVTSTMLGASTPQVVDPTDASDNDVSSLSSPLKRQRDIVSAIWPVPSEQALHQCNDFFSTYMAIKRTGLPNYVKAKIQVHSGLNLDAWDEALRNYHDREICQYLRYGWPVGYHKASPPTTTDENHQSAVNHHAHVTCFIDKELSHGAVLGPFKSEPFTPWTRTSPVMTRPKKESHERRVIVDLTFPEGQGVNDGINIKDFFGKDVTYTLPSIGDIVSQLQIFGRGAYVWKADLARAYRQLRVDPLDTPLLGMKVGHDYYLDLCPPFGCKTSSAACQRLSNAVTYLLARAGHFALAYLDDYAGCAPAKSTAQHSYDEFRCLAAHLGLQLADHKCQPPTQVITWLGYEINTLKMTVSVPQAKLDEVLDLCHLWLGKRRANKRMVQSLAGRLLFLTNCIKAGRKFMTRILDTLRSLNDKKWVTLASDFALDIRWFIRYAKVANGVFYYTPTRKEFHIECDSSLVGGGGLAGKYYYSWLYSPQHLSTYGKIHHLEAINLLVAYVTLASLVADPGALVIISTDNMASSYAIETGRTRDHVFGKCARELWLRAAISNHYVVVRHKKGDCIPMADALSRRYHDEAKAQYVRDIVSRDGLVALSPSLNNYEFFSENL